MSNFITLTDLTCSFIWVSWVTCINEEKPVSSKDFPSYFCSLDRIQAFIYKPPVFHLRLRWIFKCSFKLHFWLKRFPHSSQRYGLSPVWILLCLSRCPARSKHLPQNGQMKRFFSSNLFTVLLRTALYKLRYWPEASSPRLNSPCWSLLQGEASLETSDAWGRQYRELFPPVPAWDGGPYWASSLSYRTGGYGSPLASSPASPGSHFTRTSGCDWPSLSLSAALFSRTTSSPTWLWLSAKRRERRKSTFYTYSLSLGKRSTAKHIPLCAEEDVTSSASCCGKIIKTVS